MYFTNVSIIQLQLLY